MVIKDGVYPTPHATSHPTAAADVGVEVRPGVHRRVSWAAVFAGVVLALAIQLLLSMLGLGIGMTTIDPSAGREGLPQASSFGLGAGLWWTVSYMIALGIGGYVAARLAGVVVRGDGLIHGLLTWAFALLISAYLVTTTLGNVMGGALSALGNVTSGVTQTVKQVAPEVAEASGLSAEDLRNRAEDLLRPADQQRSGTDARTQLVSALTTMARGGPEADQARQQAVSLIAQQAGIPEDQARQRLQQVEQQFGQAKQQATQTATQAAEATSNTLSSAGIWGTVALLLGAAAAALGGRMGTQRREPSVVAD
ncbi:hypothetical protein [Azospirillum brasilense]|uniref:PhnA-like protein n=1 Tax=Azospirillum brasilense TaxID=192 RepID=A0A235HES1_AZOBR|nr:hypothetical protein [Azospirillum brasilense]OYD83725.1 hypothetical protein CHT98_14660 [Azospirillum brasilense]